MYIKKRNDLSLYSFMNIFGLVIMLTLNTLAVTLPLNGYNTGELSDRYPNLFVPIGLTFAIWGLLYICLTGFVVYSVIIDRNHSNRHENPLKSYSPLFLLSCLLNALWIVCWHYLLIAQSVVVMFALLLTLIVLSNRLKDRRGSTVIEDFFIRGSISLYLGWISVAFIANIAAYLVSLKPQSYGLSEVTWTIIVMIVAALLALYSSIVKRDGLYSVVVLWALYGIYLKHTQVFNSKYPSIVLTSIIAMVLIAMGILFSIRKRSEKDNL